MKRKPIPQTRPFKDLYLSSYLKAKNFPLHDATLDCRGRTVFHFDNTSELKKALMKYYDGTALVCPSTFIESFKGLRSLAYSLSEAKEGVKK